MNEQFDEKNRPTWIHLAHIMDVTRLNKLMNEEFDFKHYYNDFGKMEMKELVDKVKGKTKTL